MHRQLKRVQPIHAVTLFRVSEQLVRVSFTLYEEVLLLLQRWNFPQMNLGKQGRQGALTGCSAGMRKHTRGTVPQCYRTHANTICEFSNFHKLGDSNLGYSQQQQKKNRIFAAFEMPLDGAEAPSDRKRRLWRRLVARRC